MILHYYYVVVHYTVKNLFDRGVHHVVGFSCCSIILLYASLLFSSCLATCCRRRARNSAHRGTGQFDWVHILAWSCKNCHSFLQYWHPPVNLVLQSFACRKRFLNFKHRALLHSQSLHCDECNKTLNISFNAFSLLRCSSCVRRIQVSSNFFFSGAVSGC
jgi:hypothetical protein